MHGMTWIAVALAGIGGFALATFNPDLAARLGAIAKPADIAKGRHGHGGHAEHGEGGKVALTPEQIAAAGIETVPAGPAVLRRELRLPGSIVIGPEQLSVVVARVSGTLVEARKRLGDSVAAGEVVAVIDSRERAEAAGDYLAALRAESQAAATHQREDALWRKRVSAEQDVLQARGALEAARIKTDQARQRLAGFGLGADEIAALAGRKDGLSRLQQVHAPAAGKVIERRAMIGAFVAAETELFQVGDLRAVLAELSAAPDDLRHVTEGAPLRVEAEGRAAEATVLLIAPRLDEETRRARVHARLDNASGLWRAGDFITATVETGRANLPVAVPRAAVHAIKGESVVFVRTAEGFEMREVVLGQGDEQLVEIAFGLDAGEPVATRNSFAVKAELGKAEAEHSH